jgi:nucleoside-diphosphate-sugar epimerase
MLAHSARVRRPYYIAPAPIIVVTGANGFLGSHLVKLLLEANQYDVRGTVRDPTDEAKTAFLKSRCNLVLHTTLTVSRSKYTHRFSLFSSLTCTGMINASERLTLVAGDLSKPDSFDKAFEGAYAVIHTAASVTLTAPSMGSIGCSASQCHSC